nr:MFS transporter [Phytoactinopolyspora mesophila]
MFAAALSGTIVINALPRIVHELGGEQRQYTWVIAATLLAATASGPIWGKLADRMSKKLLVQLSLSVFFAGTILAGLSPTTGALIGFRVIQGLGAGGLIALANIVIATVIGARSRGRYLGYLAAVGASATVAGPPLGGLIIDVPFLGWRWCFWAGAPLAIAALVLLQKTLQVPVTTAETRLDWYGALLIPAGISVLLVWITLGGGSFDWLSWPSAAVLGVSASAIFLSVVAERRAADPVVPPHLFRDRTIVLVVVASAALEVGIVSAWAFVAQYFQIARGYAPSQSGLMMLPMMAAMVLTTLVCSRLVARAGRWKRNVVMGAALAVVALGLLGTIDRATSLWLIGVYAAVLGFGIGASVPYLIIAAQDSLSHRDLGAGTSMVMFFRLLGAAAGVSVLGAVFANHVTGSMAGGVAQASVVQAAYGDATASTFRVTAAIVLVGFICVVFIKEKPLRTTVHGHH